MVVLNRPCLIEILSKAYNLGITCANGWIFATQNNEELELTKLELSGLVNFLCVLKIKLVL